MSEIKVNSIKGVGASTAAITINNSDGTCTANFTNRTNKNLYINGACLVNQRGSSSTSEGYQTIDRFYVGSGGTNEAPTQAQVDVASGTTPYTLGFRKALKITNGNQTGGAGTADFMYLKHTFEAQDIANSGWNYLSSSSNVTLSFWVKSSVAQSFKAYFHTRQGTEYQYPFETGSLSADTWTKVTKTISGNSNLTFNSDNGLGLELYIWSFLGTDYTASSVTEDAWSTYANAARTKDATSTWYTTNDATLEMTGFQLEVSDHATDFEHRSFAQELVLCERYYEVCEGGMSVYGTSGTYHGASTQFSTKKRAAPTVTRLSDTLSSGANTPAADNVTTRAFRALAQSNAAFLQFQTVYSADCEL
jgi:hypothetical protein|tara:strand:- start:168 stop:1256 length:1089 start_codon:yes stop_codon:yes gene_type:complete